MRQMSFLYAKEIKDTNMKNTTQRQISSNNQIIRVFQVTNFINYSDYTFH